MYKMTIWDISILVVCLHKISKYFRLRLIVSFISTIPSVWHLNSTVWVIHHTELGFDLYLKAERTANERNLQLADGA